MTEQRAAQMIEVDSEVYQALAERRQGFESPNDVLRRELLPVSPPAASDTSAVLPVGDTGRCFRAGVLKVGDRLVSTQSRKGATHRAVVTPHGAFEVNGIAYGDASGALQAATGTSINGFAYWRLERTGQRLHEIRNEARTKLGLAPVIWKSQRSNLATA